MKYEWEVNDIKKGVRAKIPATSAQVVIAKTAKDPTSYLVDINTGDIYKVAEFPDRLASYFNESKAIPIL